MDPISATFVGLGVAGIGLQTYMGIESAEAQAGAANAQARANRAQAEEILRRSRINQKAAEREATELRGHQTAAYAKAGVDVSSGSPLLFMEETAARAREDIINARLESENNARLAVLGAQNLEAGAKNIRTAGYIGGVGTLLTGATNLAASAGLFKQSPTPQAPRGGY